MENSNVLHIPDPSYYPLQLFFFGRSSCMPKHSVASHVRHNYIIHFITGGSGLFSAGQHIYHLHENQGFLFHRTLLCFMRPMPIIHGNTSGLE